jgi:hypothetical protein
MISSALRAVTVLWLLAAGAIHAAQPPARPGVFGGQSLLHAHNAYPEDGRWADRIDRAIATGQVPIVIEQDIAFAATKQGTARVVVSHDTELGGTEPSLESHFFARVKPIVERNLVAGTRDRWPILVLHLDFKSNETAHHRAVWELLERYRSWLTTAPAGANPERVSPMTIGPVLVLTENGADQEKDFSGWAAARGSHLIFGSIPAPALRSSDDSAERARILRAATPSALVPTHATSYRRWVNFSWAAIEEGGPSKAADWTAQDAQRLESVVSYAHQQGLFVRFYTLNGHTAAASQGWTASYNFGSLDAVRLRWRAAVRAGVDLIATDQYEDFAAAVDLRK